MASPSFVVRYQVELTMDGGLRSVRFARGVEAACGGALDSGSPSGGVESHLMATNGGPATMVPHT